MTERISKRLRFEILRRDNHACRYCGRTAPEVKLVVDHVMPGSLGGTKDPSNLVTACEDCNNGKASTSPDAAIVADVSADAIRWARAMQQAADVLLDQQRERYDLHETFRTSWDGWGYGSPPDRHTLPLPPGWRQSVDGLIAAGLPVEILLECIDLAMARPNVAHDDMFRYMCGVAWKRVGQLRETAAALIDAEQFDNSSPDQATDLQINPNTGQPVLAPEDRTVEQALSDWRAGLK